MSIIYESKNFIIVAAKKPHIDRKDGGHIVIFPKEKIRSRQDLTPSQSIELMRLTTISGQAMIESMNKNGVDIGIINYQENGNWSVYKTDDRTYHLHLYGRAKSAKIQKYGQFLNLPHKVENPEFYNGFTPLNEKDISDIKESIEKLYLQEKYSDMSWGLS